MLFEGRTYWTSLGLKYFPYLLTLFTHIGTGNILSYIFGPSTEYCDCGYRNEIEMSYMFLYTDNRMSKKMVRFSDIASYVDRKLSRWECNIYNCSKHVKLAIELPFECYLLKIALLKLLI